MLLVKNGIYYDTHNPENGRLFAEIRNAETMLDNAPEWAEDLAIRRMIDAQRQLYAKIKEARQ